MNGKQYCAASLGLIAVCLSVGSAGAATIWSDNFEGGDFATKWPSVYLNGSGTVGVVANPAGSGNVLHLKSDAISDAAGTRSQNIGATLDETSEFHVEFDVYFPAETTMETENLFGGETSFVGPNLVFRVTEAHTAGSPFDYTVDYRDDAGYQVLTNSNVATTTWTKFLIDASGDGTFELHIGSYSNHIGTFNLKSGSWSRVFLGEGHGSSYRGEFYIDNIVITDTYSVPEPASSALVGLGGLCALLRPRKDKG